MNSRIFKIVFNVLKLKAIGGRMKDRKGVCTGWFDNMAFNIIAASSVNLDYQFSNLRLHDIQVK